MRGRAPLAVAMTASAQPNKVLTPRTTVARSKSGVSGRNIMYFIRGVSDHPMKAAWPAAQGEEAAVALSLAQMLRVDIPEDLCGGAMGGVVVKEPYDNCCSLSQSFSEAALA